jgi:catechol 2,3-dioxygenase-like lactoylglutathione lyase family enzyme
MGFAFSQDPSYMPHGDTAEQAMNKQAKVTRPQLVGINHVALEVGDVDEALAFYGRIFAFTLRGKGKGQAFIDIGDQFLALMETKAPHRDGSRHFGLVVDDRSEVRRLAEEAGAEMLPGPFLDFLDPWGNRIEVVEYADIQFSKTPQVLLAMGLDLPKRPKALKELADKGVTP